MEIKNAWEKYTAEDLQALEALNEEYKAFLDNGKTERECVTEAVAMAEKAGYRELYAALNRVRPRRATSSMPFA